MARNPDEYGIIELAAQLNSDLEMPEMLKELTWNTFDEVAEMVTAHKLVNVAYGEESDTDDFQMSDSVKMVVTEDWEEICPVSNRFNLVQNKNIVTTLKNVVNDMNMTGFMFANVRDYRDKVVIDVWFDHNSVQFADPEMGHTYWTGMEVRAANNKTESIQARGIVLNDKTGSIIRGVTDWESAKHMKSEDAESEDMSDRMYKMFSKTIFELGYYADTIVNNIEGASSVVVDFYEKDYTLEEFYREWLDDNTPDTVFDGAVNRAYKYSNSEQSGLSMWAVVMGYVSALNHDSSATDGYNNDRSHQKAREALQNPEKISNEVCTDLEDKQDDEEVDVVERAAETETEINQLERENTSSEEGEEESIDKVLGLED